MYFHSAYALIEPTMKLLFDAMQEESKGINQLMIDGICYDKTEAIKRRFNQKYGENAYEKIFYDYDLFQRIDTIKEICDTQKLSYELILSIMFDSDSLLPTVIENEVIRFTWMNPSINRNQKIVIDLIENYSEVARKVGFKINLFMWIRHINIKFNQNV